MRYEQSWNSLKEHATPSWFKDAKFGIYTHWGPYSVPGCGPNGSWYGHYMYREGTEQYNFHVKNYGKPSEFGYKEFIPLLTGEKFDPDEWAELFKRSGANFAGPVGEHHDGFSMWGTGLSQWNALNMGPKRDIVKELEHSIRAQGLRFMVALHHAENWRFFPHWIKNSDLRDPRTYALYGKPHNLDWEHGEPQGDDWPVWNEQEKPDQAFLELWLKKTQEVIDRFRPDMLWFDFGLDYIQEQYKKAFLAHYYNSAEDWGRQVVVTYKNQDLAVGSGVIDLEQGRFSAQTYHDWITDTTVDTGDGWCYLREAEYKTPESLIHYLVDTVSKNGQLLLNVGPKPDGSIPAEVRRILRGIGDWLSLNGEAIYGTTPWMTYGEGPTKMTLSGMFSDKEKLSYKAEDIRFTVRDNLLYAVCLGWPDNELLIKSLKVLYPSEIRSVELLGCAERLEWEWTARGLKIRLPAVRPCRYAYSFKITRKTPFI
jgi:Alpha-L-fucosidase